MDDNKLYQGILGLETPWRVVEVELDRAGGEVRIHIENDAKRLPCPVCEAPSLRHDEKHRRWRHLDTCQLQPILIAAVPRTKCQRHGVKQVAVPWADRGSRFTALFESLVISWLQTANVSAVAALFGLSWSAVDRIMRSAVRRGLKRQRSRLPRHLGVDETSFQKRHEYVTVVCDQESGDVVHVADGRSGAALKEYLARFDEPTRARVETVAMDMWQALEIVAEAPGHDDFKHAATLLRRQEPLPPEVAASVLTLVKSVSRQMCVALAKLKREVEGVPEDPHKLFAPNPPAHHHLDLEPYTIGAFRLKSTGPRGGRPRHARQLDQLFVVYDELRAYGATNAQAQAILAYRFKVDPRTIQRKLKQRPLTTHRPEEERPENPPEDRPPAFEPYLKSRLAVAAWSLRHYGASLDRACERVADAFGLNFERGGELADFGTEIVKSAVRECEANQSGWARVPLAVCRHEIGRHLRSWPSPEALRQVVWKSIGASVSGSMFRPPRWKSMVVGSGPGCGSRGRCT